MDRERPQIFLVDPAVGTLGQPGGGGVKAKKQFFEKVEGVPKEAACAQKGVPGKAGRMPLAEPGYGRVRA